MRKLIVLPLIGLTAIGSSQADVKWLPYAAPSGEFRIVFPSRQVSQEAHVVSADSCSIKFQTFSAQSANIKCTVAVCEAPKGLNPDEQARFVGGLIAGYKTNVGDPEYRERIIGGIHGTLLRTKRLSQEFGLWVAAHNEKIYVLSCSSRESDYLKLEANFINTFQVPAAPKKT